MKDTFLFRLKTVFLVVLLGVAVQACSERVRIIDADKRTKDEKKTYVIVRLDSSLTTLRRVYGIYPYIVATKCKNLEQKNIFPMEAEELNPQTANLFGVNQDFDRYLVGEIDTSVLKSYDPTCLYIEGGSYLGVKILSDHFRVRTQ